MASMHEVDYKVFGEDIQFVEVELDPGEAAVAEAGGMFYMEDGISMETVFGDGSQQQTSFVDALIGAGKRLLIGESLFMTVFMNTGRERSVCLLPRHIPEESFRSSSPRLAASSSRRRTLSWRRPKA